MARLSAQVAETTADHDWPRLNSWTPPSEDWDGGLASVGIYSIADRTSELRARIRKQEAKGWLRWLGSSPSVAPNWTEVHASRPNVLFLCVASPRETALNLLRDSQSISPRFPVLIEAPGDEHEALKAVLAGASGYFPPRTDGDELLQAAREIAHGGVVMAPKLTRALLQGPRPSIALTLSPREGQVLRCAATGASNAQIARSLELARATVRTHLEHIYQKLQVTNRAEAVALALAEGLLPRCDSPRSAEAPAPERGMTKTTR